MGPYRLLRLLSAGGEASVFEAEDTRLGRRVAVKLLPLAGDRAQRSAQLSEARALASLSHPLIMQLHDVLELPDALGLVLELVRGRDLASLLEATELSPGMAVHIGLDLCSALAAAHDAGICHGDLKAANILVTRDGHIKLFDFGLARRHDSKGGENEGPAGSRFSLAPEQLSGGQVDHRADLFALGSLLYRLLTGDYPFPIGGGDWRQQRLQAAATLPSVRPEGVPQALLTLVLELLAADPEQRPTSAREARQRLLALSRDLPAGDAAALAGLASRVEQAQRERPLAAYGPESPLKAGSGRRYGSLALALGVLVVLVTAFYPQQSAKTQAVVFLEGVHVSGDPGVGAARLEAMLTELVAADERLSIAAGNADNVLALHVNCATEVCSSQLVWRRGASEQADTRAVLVSESELGWKRRLRQGLRELAE